jgi:hypothetical protein
MGDGTLVLMYYLMTCKPGKEYGKKPENLIE